MRAALASLLLAVASGVAAPAGAAQTEAERIAELERKLDESVTLIGQLTERVRQLEARETGAAAAAPAAGPQADARLDAVEKEVAQLGAANVTRDSGGAGLPVHGFADVGAGTRNPLYPEYKGFSVGQLEFYLTPKLGERTLALFELTFEIDSRGETAMDLERAQIGYQFDDALTAWLGRFHTPLGYYNTAFHHGQLIATSLRRPRFLQFEDSGGILPVHTVGLWLTGGVRPGAGRLTYDVYVGNAQEIVDGTLDPRTVGASHGDFIYGGSLGYQFPGVLDGLRVGISPFTARIGDDAEPRNLTQVTTLGTYLVYDTDRWENIAEFYLFDDHDLSGNTGTHRSDAWFAQLGYRLAPATLYGRYEDASLDQADNFFAAQAYGASYRRAGAGVRFDLDERSALKFELARTHTTDRMQQQWNEALLQYAIGF